MIIETIISTVNSKEGKFCTIWNKKDNNFIYISVYPLKTLENLNMNKCAVINYTDDVSYFVDCLLEKKF